MVWILLGEMFPLRVRGPVMGVATFANWTGNLLVGQFFPVLLGAGTGTVFFIFAGVAIVACLFATRWIPETRGRSLEQIEQQLGLPAGTGEGCRAPGTGRMGMSALGACAGHAATHGAPSH
jgi:MFS family permease